MVAGWMESLPLFFSAVDKKIRRSIQRGVVSKTPKTPRQAACVPAAHSGVKLHPPQRRPHTPQHLSSPFPSPSSHVHPKRPEAPRQIEEELVPVRDTDPQSSNPLSAVEQEEKQRTAQDLLEELRALVAGQGKSDVRRINSYISEHLKIFITSKLCWFPGSVTERLLRHLEQTLSSPSSPSILMKPGASDTQAEAEVVSLQN